MNKAFLIVIIFSTFLFAQQKLTLNEAISIALQRNSSLIVSENNLRLNDKAVKASYGALLPSLGANGSWQWTKQVNDGGSTYSSQLDTIINFPTSENDVREYSVNVSGSINLFDGLANYNRISKNKNLRNAAKYSIEKAKEDIVYTTTELYYNILNFKALLKVREDIVKYNKKLLEDIQERNKLGAVAIADVYAQEVQLGNAQLALIQEENNLNLAKSRLLNFLTLDVLEEYEFEEPVISDDIETITGFMSEFNDLSAMVNSALKERKDIISQKLTLMSKEDELSIQNALDWPTISGNYGFSTRDIEIGDLFSNRTYYFGLNLSVPIFSRFSTELSIEQAKIDEINTRENLASKEREVKIEVKQGYLDLLAAKKKLEVTANNVKSATENRRINTERYNLGSGTILDVLQADSNYQNAVSERINAQFSFYKLKDNLLNVLGRLDYKNYEN